MIQKKGYWFLFANILFSLLAYCLLDYTYSQFPTISVFKGMFWGFLGAFCFSLPLLCFSFFRISLVNEFKAQKKFLWFIVFLSTTANLLWLYGIQQSTVGIVSLLENTQALFAFFLGICFLKEDSSKKLFFYIGLVCLGIFSISSFEENISISLTILILLSSFLFAFQSFCFKKWGNSTNGFPFIFLRLMGILLVLSCIFVFFSAEKTIPLKAFFLFSIAHILGVIVCRYFFFEAHKYISISIINLSILLLPVCILSLEYFIFHTTMSFQKLIGVSCIIFGIYLFIHEKGKQSSKK